ncbi:MAG: hypothetical protein RR091_10295 [Cloacibacillus sp.]
MQTKIISGPVFVDEALFGLGLSFGLTSHMDCNAAFRKSPAYHALTERSKKLAHMQGGHNKFLETIGITLDITAARYWWSQFDTYRVGITKQSESTMHTITKEPFTNDSFECPMFDSMLTLLNELRERGEFEWLKAHLPEAYLQRRIVSTNLRVLQNIYNQRKNHRLTEWHVFFNEIRNALAASPYEDLAVNYIFGEEF